MTKEEKIKVIDIAIKNLLKREYKFMCIALYFAMKQENQIPDYSSNGWDLVHEEFPELLSFSNYKSWSNTNPFHNKPMFDGYVSDAIWGYVVIDGISIPLLYVREIDRYGYSMVDHTPDAHITRARVLEELKKCYK